MVGGQLPLALVRNADNSRSDLKETIYLAILHLQKTETGNGTKTITTLLGFAITGPASLAKQIGPEHGCSLLLLVPLLQPDTSAPLCSTPGSLPLSTLDVGYEKAAVLSLSLHSTWARRERPVDVDAGAPLQYGQSTSLQADTSGPPPTYTHEAYGWIELTRVDQMIDSY